MKLVLRFFLLQVFSFLTKGQAYNLPYEKNGEECRNILTEYSPTSSNLCCSRCKPGYRLSKECTASSDTACELCKDGRYSSTMSFHSNCFRCSVCDSRKNLVYTKTCTSNSNAECQCKPGWYCHLQQPGQPCSLCRRHKTCPAGKGAESPGTHTTDVTCIECPDGKFSNETSSDPCQPHTQCEAQGMAVLHPGTSTTDTVCESQKPVDLFAKTTSDPHTTTLYSTLYINSAALSATDLVTEPSSATSRGKDSSSPFFNILLCSVLAGVMLLVVLLTVTTFIIRHRKGLRKPPVKDLTQAIQISDSKTESELLLADGKISTSSSSSASDSHSQSTGASQDSIHTEQPVVSSPCVNFSFTATINCQLNQPPGSCSMPICPQPQTQAETQPQPQPVQPDLPLSQEEQLHVSCEEENCKDALQSVQESGMTVC